MTVQVRLGAGISAVAKRQRSKEDWSNHYIQYWFNGEVRRAQKLDPLDFSIAHIQTLTTARLEVSGSLVFDNPRWKTSWLGAGEEKTVYMVVDEANRAFALELLIKDGYLNGRLTEGYYLADLRLSNLAGLKRDPKAYLSVRYSGEAKVREFIYGETLLRARNIFSKFKASFASRLVNSLSYRFAGVVAAPRYCKINRTYKDAHEANVMIELIPLHNPERKSHHLLPIPAFAQDGQLRWYFYRLTPIDVRALPH